MKLWPLAAFVTVACFSSAHVLSNPVAPTVVNGNASFNQSGNALTVTNSNGAIINWNRFSIAAGETTQFVQPSASSSVLNRVLSDPSTIHGTLSSNGQVFLINPSGIYVGPGGRIDAGGIVLSTGNISNADFLAGNLRFDPPPPSTPIVISGRLDAAGNIEIASSVLDCSGCTLNSRTGSISIDPADIVIFPPPLPLSKASVSLTPTLMVSSLSGLPPVVPAASGMLTMGGNITLTGVSSGFPSPPGGGTVTLSAGTAPTGNISLGGGNITLTGSSGFLSPSGVGTVTLSAGSVPTGNISLGGGNITLAGSSGPISLGSAPSTPSAAPDPSAAAGPAPLPVRAATPVRPVNTGGLADGTVTVRVSLVDASPITLR